MPSFRIFAWSVVGLRSRRSAAPSRPLTFPFAATSARRAIHDNLLAIAPIFAQHAYFMSAEYSIVDCCLAPLLWRLPHYGVRLGSQARPLLRYAERMFDREAFRSSLSSSERALRPA